MARFMEFVGIDHLFPEWQAWVEFVQSVMGLALALDSMKSSHPVEVPVNHPDEITEIFDAISYAKGASIIRMISSYVGMDVFMQGMRLYLERHAYGNAVTADLWRAIEEVSGIPVNDFMTPWTKEVGFPILQLSDDGSIQTSRFFGGGPETPVEGEASRWPIPVTARVEGNETIQGPWILHGPNGDASVELSDKIREWHAEGKWFKLNVDQTGFFRVAYSRQQWERLSTVMDPKTSPLSTTDRLGLISDCFAAGKAGYFSIVDALTLVAKFGEHETAGTCRTIDHLFLVGIPWSNSLFLQNMPCGRNFPKILWPWLRSTDRKVFSPNTKSSFHLSTNVNWRLSVGTASQVRVEELEHSGRKSLI